jgi:hypothetical protein
LARKTWAPGDPLTASDLNTLVVQSAPGNSRTLHIGTFSGTTDSGGYLTVTHGAGFTPTHVFAIQTNPGGGAQTGVMGVLNIGATTFQVRGNSLSVASFTGFYICLA